MPTTDQFCLQSLSVLFHGRHQLMWLTISIPHWMTKCRHKRPKFTHGNTVELRSRRPKSNENLTPSDFNSIYLLQQILAIVDESDWFLQILWSEVLLYSQVVALGVDFTNFRLTMFLRIYLNECISFSGPSSLRFFNKNNKYFWR